MAQTKAQLLGPALGDVMDFDNNTFYIDGANNRVGILQNTPTVALEVNGTIKCTNLIGGGGTTIDDWIIHTGDTNTKIGFPGNDQFEIHAGGGPRVHVNSSGYVGINTSTMSNAERLAVQLGNDEMFELRSAAQELFQVWKEGSTEECRLNVKHGGATKIHIRGNGASYFNGGNLGINNTSPNARLEITDTSTAQIRLGYNATKYVRIGRNSSGHYEFFSQENGSPLVFGTAESSDGGGAEKMRIDRYGRVQIGLSGLTGGDDQALVVANPANDGKILELATTASNGRIHFSRILSNTLNTTALIENTEPGAQGTGDLRFYTSASSNNPLERLRIKSDGGILQTKTGANVNLTLSRNESVGTDDTAVAVIDFANNTAHTVNSRIMAKTAGTSNVGGDLVVETRANGGSLTEKFRITGAGNVLIGTTSATSEFTVKGTGTVAAFEGTGGNGAIMLKDVDDGTLAFALVDGGNFDIQTSGGGYSTKLRVTPSGQVLVGRTAQYASSAEKLSVNGMLSVQKASTSVAGLYVFNTDTTGSGTVQPYIFLHDGGGNRGGFGLQYSTSNLIINGQSDIQFRTGASGVAGTERLRITSSGQIKKAQGANVTSLKSYDSHGDAFWLDHYQHQTSGTYRRYTDVVSVGDSTWGSNIRVFTNEDGNDNTFERLRISKEGSLSFRNRSGYWQITAIHNGNGSGSWYSGSAAQRIYPAYYDKNTGYGVFYLTFHPSVSHSGFQNPQFVIRGGDYLQSGGLITMNTNNRTNSPSNGTFRCYHLQASWQAYNDGDTDQVSGQREMNANVQHKSAHFGNSSLAVDYIPTNDSRYGTNAEPLLDQKSYLKVGIVDGNVSNPMQGHTMFCKFETFTNAEKAWYAYMVYNW